MSSGDNSSRLKMQTDLTGMLQTGKSSKYGLTTQQFQSSTTQKGIKQIPPPAPRKLAPLQGAAQRRAKELASQQQFEDQQDLRMTSEESGRGSRRKITRGQQERTQPSRQKEDLQQEANPKNVSESLIEEGYIQSFVDFFQVTHNRLDTEDINMSPQDFTNFKNTLIQAEQALRQDAIDQSVDLYSQLGSYFQSKGLQKSTQYFFERCLDIAKESESAKHEAKANMLLGQSVQAKGNVDQAVEYFETAMTIAQKHDFKELRKQTATLLVENYINLAEKTEKAGNVEESLKYHQKCLKATQLSDNQEKEGETCYRIGLVHLEHGKYEEALQYQKQYLKISEELKRKKQICEALSALAQIHQELGHIPTAIEQLETLKEVAEDAGETRAKCSAAFNLGLLYHQQGLVTKAVDHLEEHYNLAKSAQVNDKQLIDSAKVSLAIAQATCTFGKLLTSDKYIEILDSNLLALLQWKNKRMKFQ